MQLKREEKRRWPEIQVFLKRLNCKKIYFLAVLFIFLAGSLFGMGISGSFGSGGTPKSVVKGIAKNISSAIDLSSDDIAFMRSIFRGDQKSFLNYIDGYKSNPERIVIDIKNNDFQKLAYKREVALATGILLSSDDDYVPAKIHHNNKTVNVELRLKGDWTDHLEGEKWSFRIKVKGDDTLFGMKVFSIQQPKTRNYINEWLFQKMLEREGIVAIRYDFIDVTINGKHKGIYALEEFFDKRLIEHNRFREGPIIRFNENLKWLDQVAGTDYTHGYYLLSSEIDAFQTNKIIEDPALYGEFLKAKDLLESFRNGSLKTSEVFDVDKLAKLMAISDLLGADHGTRWINQRFYYNPITSKLEPVGYDANAGNEIRSLGLFGTSNLGSANEPFQSMVYKDPVFYEKYVQELERISQKSYLDDLFIELKEEMQNSLNIIYKDYPFYHFSNQVFYNNQNYIRNMLHPAKGMHPYFNKPTINGTIIIEFGNIQSMPLEVLDVSYKDLLLKPIDKKIILWGKNPSEPVQYEKYEFILPSGYNWSEKFLPDLRINYKVLGHSLIRNETVIQWQHLSDDKLIDDFIRKGPNLNEFNFLLVDNTTRKIIIKSGNWELNRSLIIPGGYKVIWQPEVASKLDLRNNATILSYSPFEFLGDEDHPITITSSDSTGQGITVLNAGGRSILERVIFSNLSAPSQEGWKLTGPVTFYNSNVDINMVEFSDNKYGDDMLNIVRSEYTITNSLFKNTLFDALDNDFAKGTISKTVFINIGNDAMDFSGSLVNITEVSVNGTGDKGVSVGEESQVSIDKIDLKNCNIAIASKDLSSVNLNNVRIYSSNVGLAAYQKKPEFGPSEIRVFNIESMNVTVAHLIEVNSKLSLDDKEIIGTQNKLYERLDGK